MSERDRLSPTVFVIFGGAGDLSWRKLTPALFDLFIEQNMPRKFLILVVDSADYHD